jgi:hypothetical protein
VLQAIQSSKGRPHRKKKKEEKTKEELERERKDRERKKKMKEYWKRRHGRSLPDASVAVKHLAKGPEASAKVPSGVADHEVFDASTGVASPHVNLSGSDEFARFREIVEGDRRQESEAAAAAKRAKARTALGGKSSSQAG